MGEISRIDWLDQLTFRAIEQQGLLRPKPPRTLSTIKQAEAIPVDQEGRKVNGTHHDAADKDRPQAADAADTQQDSSFTLFIDFPRFDFPIVFTDHEYPPPLSSSRAQQTSSSSNITLKPPPGVHGGSGSEVVDSDNDPYGRRIVKIYDPEVFARDNPAESMHRRLVRSHRTSILDRDLKPNAKIRDELNVRYSDQPHSSIDAPSSQLA